MEITFEGVYILVFILSLGVRNFITIELHIHKYFSRNFLCNIPLVSNIPEYDFHNQL